MVVNSNASGVVAAVFVVVFSGCGGSPSAPLPHATSGLSAPRNARTQLAAGDVDAVVVPAGSYGQVVGHAILQTDDPDAPLAVGSSGGSMSVGLDAQGNLVVASAHLVLADLVLTPEELPPSGLRLTHLAFDLQRPISASPTWYANGAEGAAALQGNFVLSGELVVADGGPSPFEPQDVDALQLQAQLSTDDFDDVLVHFHVVHPGVVWSWQGLYELRDLSFDGQAIAASDASAEAQP